MTYPNQPGEFNGTQILRHTSWDFEQYCDDRWANIGSLYRIGLVKGFLMKKIAMEGMDVVDVGIRPVLFFFLRGYISSTQILHIQ